jgi:hypothetical protein
MISVGWWSVVQVRVPRSLRSASDRRQEPHFVARRMQSLGVFWQAGVFEGLVAFTWPRQALQTCTM